MLEGIGKYKVRDMKSIIGKYIFVVFLLLGVILIIPTSYSAATSFGIIQVIGSLFGGDLKESDGFIWSRGGFEGTIYLAPAIDAIGILVGGCFIIVGLLGMISRRSKSK